MHCIYDFLINKQRFTILKKNCIFFCLRSSSWRTDLSIDFQPSRPTTIWMSFFWVTLKLSSSAFYYETDHRKCEMMLCGWHCGLRLFKLGRPLHTEFEPRSLVWLVLYRPERYHLHHRGDKNSSTSFCLTSCSSSRTDLSIPLQPRRPTTIWMFFFLITLTLSSSTFYYETDHRECKITLGGWHCSLRFFKLERPLYTGFEPRSTAWLACFTGHSATTYSAVAISLL